MTTPQNEPTIESHIPYRGGIVNLRVDKVQLRNGSSGTREIVEHNNCVCIVPLDEKNNVLMVRQYRKPAEQVLLEIPAGSIENGEDPYKAALREMQEETGHTPGELKHLSSFWTTPGFCTEFMHAYVARDIRQGSFQPDEDEDIEIQRVPIDQVPDMIRKGEIRDAKSIASLLMVLHPGSGDI